MLSKNKQRSATDPATILEKPLIQELGEAILRHFSHPHCWALSILALKSCSSRTALRCHWIFFDFLAKELSISAEEFLIEQNWSRLYSETFAVVFGNLYS
jgi:hypothetical protein